MSRHSRSFTCFLLATCALAACKPAAAPANDAATTASATPTSAAPAAAPSALAKIAGDLNPLASPKDALKASMDKFLAVRSYHATMEVVGGPIAMGHNEIDFVAPDRFRMQSPRGTQIIIGDTMYGSVRGHAMKVPMPAGTFVTHFGKQIHYDGAKDEETISQVWGMGPNTSTPAEKK